MLMMILPSSLRVGLHALSLGFRNWLPSAVSLTVQNCGVTPIVPCLRHACVVVWGARVAAPGDRQNGGGGNRGRENGDRRAPTRARWLSGLVDSPAGPDACAGGGRARTRLGADTRPRCRLVLH